MDGICPEIPKDLDIVGLSWLTCLLYVTWRLGTAPVEWPTGVVVPNLKKGDWRVCAI